VPSFLLLLLLLLFLFALRYVHRIPQGLQH